MPRSEIESLKAAIRRAWPAEPSPKARRYVNQFFNAIRVGQQISAQVVGNHGTYTVSIQVDEDGLSSACSCYIGKGGYCHHCAALAFTFLNDANAFRVIKPKRLEEVRHLDDVHDYLQHVTLDALIQQLRENGITQQAIAESIGMNPRHLSAIKSSERRHHYFNELGATKLACLWVLKHLGKKADCWRICE